MKIGYVLKVYPRLSETFVVSELLAQEAAGLELEVFSLRPSEDAGVHAAHAGVRAPVTYLPSAGITVGQLEDELRAADPRVLPAAIGDAREESPRELLQALVLARLVGERGIEHLHAHFANVAATVARLAARMAGITYSLTAHAKDIFHEEVDDARLRRLLLDASAVVTVSDFNARHLRGLCPDAAERVHRVYNGVELDRFTYSEPADRPPRIAGVGRLVEKKGWPDLLAACRLLADRGRAFDCVIAGAGLLDAQLRAQVAELGLEGHVTLLGPRSQEEVRALVQDAAVLAAPCVLAADGNRDGLPTVLLEAMALGTPCVSTDVTGIPEILRDGETGLAVPQRDPEALAAALERLLDDPGLRVRLAAAGRRLVEEQFDVHANVARWRDAVLAREEVAAGAPGLRLR